MTPPPPFLFCSIYLLIFFFFLLKFFQLPSISFVIPSFSFPFSFPCLPPTFSPIFIFFFPPLLLLAISVYILQSPSLRPSFSLTLSSPIIMSSSTPPTSIPPSSSLFYSFALFHILFPLYPHTFSLPLLHLFLALLLIPTNTPLSPPSLPILPS